jgi:hypothetical protein
MERLVEYRFKISGFTPKTLPLQRLATYLDCLSEILGAGDNMHLLRIETSSAMPVIGILERESLKTERRLWAIKSGGGPIAAKRAYQSLDRALSEDSANGALVGPMGVLMEFPGSSRPKPAPPLGPIEDEATVDGEVVQISGRDESISVYLRKDRHEQICTGTRAQGRELARYMFTYVRVFGIGAWIRDADGHWELQDMTIQRFVPQSDAKFSSTIQKLHSIDSARVRECGDPTEFLEDLRRGGIQ